MVRRSVGAPRRPTQAWKQAELLRLLRDHERAKRYLEAYKESEAASRSLVHEFAFQHDIPINVVQELRRKAKEEG